MVWKNFITVILFSSLETKKNSLSVLCFFVYLKMLLQFTIPKNSGNSRNSAFDCFQLIFAH